MANRHKGLFITIEGGEGSGKSTLMLALAKRLGVNGMAVITTREPGGTPLAESVRSLVLHPPQGETWSALAEALLMNTARADHLEKRIRPSLEQGKYVLCDRFSDSTRAYQSAGGKLALEDLIAIESIVLGETKPDITFILDASPEKLVERRRQRGECKDVFELRDLAFHTAVRKAFLDIAIAEPDRCHVLDALLDETALLGEAWTIVSEHMMSARTA